MNSPAIIPFLRYYTGTYADRPQQLIADICKFYNEREIYKQMLSWEKIIALKSLLEVKATTDISHRDTL